MIRSAHSISDTNIAGLPNFAPQSFKSVSVTPRATFLSGGAVSAAGEIAVEDGWVRMITAKSGHDMPTVANMQRFVQTFPLILGNAGIRPDFGDTRGGAPPKCYYVGDFRRDGTAAATLNRAQVMPAIPAFAQTAEAQRWINRVPV